MSYITVVAKAGSVFYRGCNLEVKPPSWLKIVRPPEGGNPIVKIEASHYSAQIPGDGTWQISKDGAMQLKDVPLTEVTLRACLDALGMKTEVFVHQLGTPLSAAQQDGTGEISFLFSESLRRQGLFEHRYNYVDFGDRHVRGCESLLSGSVLASEGSLGSREASREVLEPSWLAVASETSSWHRQLFFDKVTRLNRPLKEIHLWGEPDGAALLELIAELLFGEGCTFAEGKSMAEDPKSAVRSALSARGWNVVEAAYHTFQLNLYKNSGLVLYGESFPDGSGSSYARCIGSTFEGLSPEEKLEVLPPQVRRFAEALLDTDKAAALFDEEGWWNRFGRFRGHVIFEQLDGEVVMLSKTRSYDPIGALLEQHPELKKHAERRKYAEDRVF